MTATKVSDYCTRRLLAARVCAVCAVLACVGFETLMHHLGCTRGYDGFFSSGLRLRGRGPPQVPACMCGLCVAECCAGAEPLAAVLGRASAPRPEALSNDAGRVHAESGGVDSTQQPSPCVHMVRVLYLQPCWGSCLIKFCMHMPSE